MILLQPQIDLTGLLEKLKRTTKTFDHSSQDASIAVTMDGERLGTKQHFCPQELISCSRGFVSNNLEVRGNFLCQE